MPPYTTTRADIDRYELATLLAGLRLLQATPVLPEAIEEIATEEGDFERLDEAQIDALCERINAVSEHPWRDVTEGDVAETEAMEARIAGLFEEIE